MPIILPTQETLTDNDKAQLPRTRELGFSVRLLKLRRRESRSNAAA